KIENSQLIILNGGGLEVWGNNIKKNIDIKNTIIVSAGEGLITKKTTADGQTITDPHVWLAPPLAQKMIDKITEGFKQVDPQNKNYYETNASLLKNKLSDLDTAYKQGLSRCQEKNIITSHTAFSYLATTYGFNQVSIAGLSPAAEPSSQQLANIVDFSRKNKVSYIFFESLVSPKLAQTIATEIGAQTLVLDPIEGLTDEKKLAGKNYLSIMQDNLINLQIALKCTK
ncbi:MAG: zinc ABC transporter substrate-binding protein, partial [Candidatus Falkowbacteria bacterium]|nr:zinc ABC transporter substrate-binding protein [Candidatus Falkowbacteria bacterium]